jgi:hypothetical protein
MKFSLRDLIWFTLAMSLLILLLLEKRHRIAAVNEAQNRSLENEYLHQRTTVLTEQVFKLRNRPESQSP